MSRKIRRIQEKRSKKLDQEIHRTLKNARTEYAAGNLSQASKLYQRILYMDQGNADALYDLGMIFFATKKFDTAIAWFTRAIEVKPNEAHIYNALGNVYDAQEKYHLALKCYERAILLNPDYVDAMYNCALSLHKLEKYNLAIEMYKRVLSKNPEFIAALSNLGVLQKQLDQPQEAISSFRKVLSIDPNNALAKHLAASIEGEVVAESPKEYVEGLFDGLAENFEASLVDKLGYSIPNVMKRLIENVPRGQSKFSHALDLGCGTGLAAEMFCDRCGSMTGVDVSSKMIEKAREKSLYDDLYIADISEFLLKNKISFDLVLATDVFVYTGDLDQVFALVRMACAQGGLFAFSVEGLESGCGRGYELLPTGRFSHSPEYIKSLADKHTFDVLVEYPTDIRKEKNAWIKGYCFILRIL